MTIRIVVKNENQKAKSQSETFTLEDLLISIGSGNQATLRLVGAKIAAEQAVIVNEDKRPLFINQAKGTVLNGQELEQGFPHEITTGDQVRIGSYHLTIELNGKYLPEKTEDSLKGNLSEEKSFGGNGQTQVPNFDENLFAENDLTPPTTKLEAGTFADILSSLRKDEDQFYFQLIEQNNAKRRILVESDETVLGWNSVNNFFATDKETALDEPQAFVRKDWNGVTIYPNGNQAILINDALLEAGCRLKNNDKLVFSYLSPTASGSVQTVTLVFCEPAALVELNAILPQQLVSSALETNYSGEITAVSEINEPPPQSQPQRENVPTVLAEVAPAKKKNPFYFGYFMLTEIIIMIVATALTAVLTYVLLELS